MTGFDIGGKHVGDGAPCLIVAEVAQAHEGSVRIAHEFIDAVADAGADCIKFQCHIAEAESTSDEEWRVEPRWRQDASRYDYWERMEFRWEDWSRLHAHATSRGLIFLCSPFSVEAVKLLDPLVPAWKVASGEITNEPLLKAIRATGKPPIFSTGMANEAEMRRLREPWHWPDGYAVLQCTSMYPCPPGKVDVGALEDFGTWVYGLSDHSGTIWPSIAAVTLGASIVEVHVKLSQYDQGFDASSSITIPELKQLVEGVRFIEKAKQPVDKDQMAKELEPMRKLFMDRHIRRAERVELA